MKLPSFVLILFIRVGCCIELYQTDRCPDEYKESEWIKAGIRLGCYDNELPNKQTLAYYCIYDISVDSIYEFCAESFVVSPQLCPIFNFFTSPPVINFYNCSGDKYTCPSEQYRSENFYQYGACDYIYSSEIILKIKKDLYTMSDSNRFSPRIICMADIHTVHKKPPVTTTTSKTSDNMHTCYKHISTILVLILLILFFICISIITPDPDHRENILE